MRTLPHALRAPQENDAGLCYDKCQSGMKGIGPVCWGQCGGARPVDCGAFCARDSGSCADLGVRIGQTGGKYSTDLTLYSP